MGEDGWQYLDFRNITMLVGGERWRQEPEHKGSVWDGYVLEIIRFKPTPAQWQALARADSVEGKIGINEFIYGLTR